MTRRSFWQRLIGGAVAAVAVRETMPAIAPVVHPEAPLAASTEPCFVGYSQTGALGSGWVYTLGTQTITTNATTGETLYVMNGRELWAESNGQWTRL